MLWAKMRSVLNGLFRRSRVESEIDEELKFHIEEHARSLATRGLTTEEASRRARIDFGSADKYKEEARQARGLRLFDESRSDLAFATRMLRKNPGFAFTAIVTLALGIGANTTIFSAVNAVLIQPLPYVEPDRLYALHQYIEAYDNGRTFPIRARDFAQWQRVPSPFSDFTALAPASFSLRDDGEPERVGAALASANLFALLGVHPELGRGFAAGEDESGRDRVIVISHGLWSRRFASDEKILGKTVTLSGQTHVIIGVLPSWFLFPTGKQLHPLTPFASRIDIWKPLAFTDRQLAASGSFNYEVLGRLKSGISPEQARQQMDTISIRLGQESFPVQVSVGSIEMRTELLPIRQVFSGNVRQGLLVLLAAVGLLLLIACVNIANLLLARATARNREMSVRAALGAAPSRIGRQLLTESFFVAVLGAALGIILAYAAGRILIWNGSESLPLIERVRIDGFVLLFTTMATILTTVICGWLPARKAMRQDFQAGLKEGRTVSDGRRTRILREGLVALEVALSTALLVAAGLLLHSYVQLMAVDKGFDVERILSIELALPVQRVSFYEPLIEGIEALPGVLSAGAINHLPLSSETDAAPVFLESDDPERLLLERPVATLRGATPGYFQTMGIPLRAGRFFGRQEIQGAVVVSEELARALWPGEPLNNVIGRQIRLLGRDNPNLIVGVAGEIKTDSLERKSVPQLYWPHSQVQQGNMAVVVRTAGEPGALASAVRSLIREMDANLPIPEMKTMRERVSASVAQRRFQLLLIVLFATLALTLALVGIYGVINYSVARQTGEIGLRMALGAMPGQVLRSVLVQGLVPVGVGLVVGLIGAVAFSQLLQSLLFGITPLDPVTLMGVAMLVVLAASTACYAPARRAARLDPMNALRCE